MALEPGSGRISVSPTSSGRASPVGRKWRTSDDPPSKDKAFRKYAAGVDRSLSQFDAALQDWADYISFLGRLLKALQAHPTATVVPSKASVAKRLAQCLNPSLPSGVHQKALEVYGFIFSMIGKDALSRDLPLYFPGLSPTLSFASLSARTPFLELLETHLLKLDDRSLRPALKAIILTLLPGLEEETSEDFERTLKLLDGFKHATRPPNSKELNEQHSTGDEYFWQCFFLATITSNDRRLGALAYLIRNLPNLGPTSAEMYGMSQNATYPQGQASNSAAFAAIVTSPEPGLLLRCFAAGLSDDQILIQRGFLDLLVTHISLHSPVLQQRVKAEDLELLIKSAAGVVARRDMSLNRRLWTWLLGPEPTGNDGEHERGASQVAGAPTGAHQSSRTAYFEAFGLQPLTYALLRMIEHESLNPLERARPFRICLSLMDRWEIGGLLVPDVFLPLVNSVRKYKEITLSKADFSEVLRSASVFFDGVESGLIWGEIFGLINQALGAGGFSTGQRLEKLSMVSFIVRHFNIREEGMLVVHAPLTALAILSLLAGAKGDAIQPPVTTRTLPEVSKVALTIAMNLVELVPGRAFYNGKSSNSTAKASDEICSDHAVSDFDILQRIRRFYADDQGSLDNLPATLSSWEMGELLIRRACSVTCQTLLDPASSAEIGISGRLLISMLHKLPETRSLDVTHIMGGVHDRLEAHLQVPFSSFSGIISLVIGLYSASFLTAGGISNLVDPLVRVAWSYLSASHPKYHVETVRCLLQLQASLSTANHEIEAALCSLMVEKDLSGTPPIRNADPGRTFVVLWVHTLQESGQFDRRSSKAPGGDGKGTLRATGAHTYKVMLTRPLFLFLDALFDERTQLYMTVRAWLQNLVGSDKLFNVFVGKFLEFDFLQIHGEDKSNTSSTKVQTDADKDDLDQCLYYLQLLSNVLRWSSDSIWLVLAESPTPEDVDHSSLHLMTGHHSETSLLQFFVHVCLQAISGNHTGAVEDTEHGASRLHRMALTTLHQILRSPYSLPLAQLHLENILIDRLRQSLDVPDPSLQVLLLDTVSDALKMQSAFNGIASTRPPTTSHKRSITQEQPPSSSFPPSIDRGEDISRGAVPPLTLIKCLQAGLSAPNSRFVLENWVELLTECLPLYSESIFQVLIPLVETFCSQVSQIFTDLQELFLATGVEVSEVRSPESTLITLLNGLEHVLARGHDRLLQEEQRSAMAKSPDQQQGFFGNMVSGVFASETPQTRSANANNRLTVLLSFRDAVRICFRIWSWGEHDGSVQDTESVASFTYTSLRMRNRARRLLEHLFAAEALECLETMVEVWQTSWKPNKDSRSLAIFNLLHVLDGSSPRHTIPAIFNAIYSRTNPAALDPVRMSTLTSSLSDVDLVSFLVEYARSIEDDAMDEIWADCMTFLRDLLANPFPHRQTLPSVLEFAAILGEKVDNTNFGEQRRMRRELGDIFLRLLTAIFTTRPIGFSENANETDDRTSRTRSLSSKSDDLVAILASIAPNLSKILVEQDRVLSATNTISASLIGPTFKSKSFPDNVLNSTLKLLYQLSRLPGQKSWKRDIGDAFNDARFFATGMPLIVSDWLPLLRQWSMVDKERMPELLSRILAPSTAGIVFGVGATSARLEADRKTQLNLRRVATLIMASPENSFIADLPAMQEKIVDLLSATSTSSPSSTTRADIYILLRTLALKTSAVHLATIWPTVNAELDAAISSVAAPDHSQASETYNNLSVLQACKLLDMLLCIAPDDFQLHEWLFITDTIDAIHRPVQFQPMALLDQLAEELGATALNPTIHTESEALHPVRSLTRRPLLGIGGISVEGSWERKDELVGKVLRPFFSQLSIFAFESTYSMSPADQEACRMAVLNDLFDEKSIVKAL